MKFKFWRKKNMPKKEGNKKSFTCGKCHQVIVDPEEDLVCPNCEEESEEESEDEEN